MSATIGNARISEFGTVVGKRGDQTKKEVMTQSFASGGRTRHNCKLRQYTAERRLEPA